VVLVDPPPFGYLESLAARGGESPWSAGYLHPAWGPAELDLARRVHAAEWDMGETLPRVFRALRSVEAAAGDSLVALLEGSGRHPRSAEQSARSVRVLVELGLLAWAQDGGERGLRVVSSERTDLERSAAYRAYRSRHEEGERFLSSQEAVR
jgi:hypothetical protein